MEHNLTNLLSRERIKALQKSYYMRLATLLVVGIGILALFEALLLFPSYQYAKDQVTLYTKQLETIQSAGTEGEASTAERFSALTKDAERVLGISSFPSTSETLQRVLALPRPGVTLLRFTLESPTTLGGEGKIVISGTAATRESLRTYEKALQSLSFITRVELPLSSYAKERDISFTVTLYGPLTTL
jgi:hypothetical protein